MDADDYYDDGNGGCVEYGDEYGAYEDDDGGACFAPAAAAAALSGDAEDPASSAEAAALNAIFRGDRLCCIAPSLPLQYMRLQARRLASLFCVSVPFAERLLRAHRFSLELASEGFATDPQAVYQRLGVPCEAAATTNTFRTAAVGDLEADSEPPACGVCLAEEGEDPRNHLVALSSCGHWFCLDCWADDLRARVSNGSSVLAPACMADGCPQLADTTDLVRLLPVNTPATNATAAVKPDGTTAAEGEGCDRTLLSLLQRSILSEYSRGNSRLSWCANPKGCDKILFSPNTGSSAPVLTCPDCGFPFCGVCRAVSHRPASCAEFQSWDARIQNGGASLAKIMNVTKPCPECRERIEKNSGCNHMTCRCGHQFCWICMGNWSKHSGSAAYSCRSVAVVPPPATAGGGRESDEVRSDVTFLQFFTPFDSHMQSLRLETRSLDSAVVRARVVVDRQMDLFDNHLLEENVLLALARLRSVVTRARTTLAATYVRAHAYTIAHGDRDAEDLLLLHQRGSLMNATEAVSALISLLSTPATKLIDLEEVDRSVAQVIRATAGFDA